MAADESGVGGEASPAPVTTEIIKPECIAILGSHPVTKMAAPFDDPKCVIYACSPDNSPHGSLHADGKQHCSPLPRVDLWFELHKPIADVSRPYGYLRWLESLSCPVMMRDQIGMKFFPNARPYPEEQLKKRFGPPIFSSSVAYMIAYAIVACEEHGIKQIGLFGILQGGQTEYFRHLTGTQQMLWEAQQAGIEIGGPHPLSIPPLDSKGRYRQTYMDEVEALKRLLSLEPVEDW